MSFWAGVYSSDPQLRRLELMDADPHLRRLNECLDFVGTVPTWGERWKLIDSVDAPGATSGWVLQHLGESRWVHVGDALSPHAAEVGRRDGAEAVDALLAIPERHYFVDSRHERVIVVGWGAGAFGVLGDNERES
ncbi:MAG: hypothetical protein ACRBI6_12640 [Acidimicrobiales bacterium]